MGWFKKSAGVERDEAGGQAPLPPPTPVAKAEVSPFAQLGNRSLTRHNSGARHDEFLTELKGQRASQVFLEMRRNDPVVGAVLFAITSTLRAVEWHVEPAGTAPADMDAADFVASVMHDMSHTWPDFIGDVVSMLPYGFAPFEVCYKLRQGPEQADPTRRSRYSDGRVGWRKLVLLPQETVSEFKFDDNGGIQVIQQRLGYAGGETIDIPIEKALLFRTDHHTPWGVSVLRNAYVSWYYKTKIQAVEAIGIERDLAGLPVLTVDADYLARHNTELRNIIRNLRRDEQEGVLLPGEHTDSGLVPYAELKLLSSGGTRQFNTDAVVARHNRGITMSLLQDVLLLGHEKIGTQSLASEKRDLSDLALSAWLQEIEAIINLHAVPRLLQLNGMSLENPPRICHGEISPIDAAEFATALKTVTDAGWQGVNEPAVDALIRRRLGLPPAQEGQE